MGRKCFYILLLTDCCVGLKIVQTLPHPFYIAQEGENTTLACETDSPWFFCLWNSPQQDRQCAIQEAEPVSVCRESAELRLVGNRSYCSVEISSLERKHHGDWLCLLSDIQDFQSVRRKVKVSVGKQVNVGWNGEYRTGELVMTDGETRNLTCLAEQGLPAPRFTWLGQVNLTLSPGAEEGWLLEDDLYTAWQTVIYTANLNHTGLNITCKVDQFRENEHLMYTSYSSLRLVIKPILPEERLVRERLGLLSGILVAILLLAILVSILVVLIITRSRNQKYCLVHEEARSPILKNQDIIKRQREYDGLGAKQSVWRQNRMSKKAVNRNALLLQRNLYEDHFRCCPADSIHVHGLMKIKQDSLELVYPGSRSDQHPGSRSDQYQGSNSNQHLGSRLEQDQGSRSDQYLRSMSVQHPGSRSDQHQWSRLDQHTASSSDHSRLDQHLGSKSDQYLGLRSDQYQGSRSDQYQGSRSDQHQGSRLDQYLGSRSDPHPGPRSGTYFPHLTAVNEASCPLSQAPSPLDCTLVYDECTPSKGPPDSPGHRVCTLDSTLDSEYKDSTLDSGYKDSTLDSGYVTKDGYPAYLDETSDSNYSDPNQTNSGEIHKNAREIQKSSHEIHKNASEIHENSHEIHENSHEIHKNSREIHECQTYLLEGESGKPIHVADTTEPVHRVPVTTDSVCHLPRTAKPVYRVPGASQPVYSRLFRGQTIFDCEQGCFISVEEYNRRYGSDP